MGVSVGNRGFGQEISYRAERDSPRRYGDVEDFSHNINPFGPLDTLNDMIISVTSSIGHYPDDSCVDFREDIFCNLFVPDDAEGRR